MTDDTTPQRTRIKVTANPPSVEIDSDMSPSDMEAMTLRLLHAVAGDPPSPGPASALHTSPRGSAEVLPTVGGMGYPWPTRREPFRPARVGFGLGEREGDE